MDDDELIEYEKVVPKVKDKKPADDEAEDSGDAAKENAGAARGSKPAAAKPAKAQKPPKKRAASDCDSDDAEFELEAPPAKRTKPAKVLKVADVKKEEDDQDFFNAVKAVRRAFKKENSNRYDLTRGLVLKLGLLEPSPEAFEQVRRIAFCNHRLPFCNHSLPCCACSARSSASSSRTSPVAKPRAWLSSFSRFCAIRHVSRASRCPRWSSTRRPPLRSSTTLPKSLRPRQLELEAVAACANAR